MLDIKWICKNMRNYFLLMFFLWVGNVQAATWGTDCNYNVVASTITLPANVKITIDPNAPVGTVFFEHLDGGPMSGLVKCKTALSFSQTGAYAYESGGASVSMTGYGLTGTYPVYKTNIPGVGVVVRMSNRAFPFSYSTSNISNDILNYSWGSSFDVDIIKYDDIPSGVNTININSLNMPVIDRNVIISNSSDTVKLPNGTITLQRFTFNSASIDIVTGTCDTPDVSVNLGSRKVSDSANRAGTKFASPWVDASIRLTNCPVFYGTGERGTLKDATRNNVMTVTLIPGNATTSNQGIMPIDNVSMSAVGVGIQLAHGTAASPQYVDFSSGQGSKSFTMSSTQGSTYTIPLVARYMQTSANISGVLPGKGNGKVTYLIDYY